MKKHHLIILVIINIILIIANIFIWKDSETSEENVSVKATKFYSGKAGESDLDTVWCGSFQLAWNELIKYVGSEIEFEGEESSSTLTNLNNQTFTKEMLSEEDYYIKTGKATPSLKQEILKNVEEKFGIKDSSILNKMNFENSNGIAIYTMLFKEFEFLEEFDDMKFSPFYEDEDTKYNIRYFGMTKDNFKKIAKNVEVLCYDKKFDEEYRTIIKLKTKSEDEVILYKKFKTQTTQEPVEYEYRTFDELYQEVLESSNQYDGDRQLKEYDILKIPYINMNISVNYDELCNKEIKGTGGEYISNALQTINFSLDAKGGKVKSEAGIITDSMSAPPTSAKWLEFDRPFVIFIKEKNAEKPYFAARINNGEFLELKEN